MISWLVSSSLVSSPSLAALPLPPHIAACAASGPHGSPRRRPSACPASAAHRSNRWRHRYLTSGSHSHSEDTRGDPPLPRPSPLPEDLLLARATRPLWLWLLPRRLAPPASSHATRFRREGAGASPCAPRRRRAWASAGTSAITAGPHTRGLHSFPFQLNLSASFHRITQLDS